MALGVCPPGTKSALRCFWILLVLAIPPESLRPELKVLGEITFNRFAASPRVTGQRWESQLSPSFQRKSSCSHHMSNIKRLNRKSVPHSASLLIGWSQERGSVFPPAWIKFSSCPGMVSGLLLKLIPSLWIQAGVNVDLLARLERVPFGKRPLFFSSCSTGRAHTSSPSGLSGAGIQTSEQSGKRPAVCLQPFLPAASLVSTLFQPGRDDASPLGQLSGSFPFLTFCTAPRRQDGQICVPLLWGFVGRETGQKVWRALQSCYL